MLGEFCEILDLFTLLDKNKLYLEYLPIESPEQHFQAVSFHVVIFMQIFKETTEEHPEKFQREESQQKEKGYGACFLVQKL